MEKIKQTKFGENGNCLEACIASLLGININNIPVLPKDNTWQSILNDFLIKNYGMYLVTLCIKDGIIPDCFYGSKIICVGESNRGLLHAVIFEDYEMIHDPHPSNSGIKKIEEIDLLVKYF